VADTGIAAWHTIGVTHFCRPEDFPVMPCEYAGSTLKPFGFFDRNPGIDLAPSASAHGATVMPGSTVMPEDLGTGVGRWCT
jgi:primary-amine oxidase